MMIDRRTLLKLTPAVLLVLAAPSLAFQRGRTAIQVHKTPWCGCCSSWVAHLRANGFQPVVAEHESLDPIAQRLGVPDRLRSCHTAQVGGYFIEGHVPAADIMRLLAQRPAALGLAVPGMPVGSPGMEQGGRRQPYQTLLVGRGGATRVFAQH